MSDSDNQELINKYLRAANRENTVKSYRSAIVHYEQEWGGRLPATVDDIKSYLAHFADKLAFSTLNHRVAVLSKWHKEYGFNDPTKNPQVPKILKGIRTLHPSKPRKARPIMLSQLLQIVDKLQSVAESADSVGERMVLLRDRAIFLLGFWRAFRSDELSRIQVEDIDFSHSGYVEIFLHRTKSDRNNEGTTVKLPKLDSSCPVQAIKDWLEISKLQSGPVFRSINRWGQINTIKMSPASIINIIKARAKQAGLEDPEKFSSHSLRRGFATWATQNGWSVKELMDYVGWKDPKTAMEYIDTTSSIERLGAINQIPKVTRTAKKP